MYDFPSLLLLFVLRAQNTIKRVKKTNYEPLSRHEAMHEIVV